ncbi:hypothetical protein Tco_0614648 [Tanacetum coccineum]
MASFGNTNYHTSIQTTHFEIVYGHVPPIHVPYHPGKSSVESVDRTLQARKQAFKMLQFHLARAQGRMKNMADKHRSDRCFEPGMKVYLKLQPHRQVTVRVGQQNKFLPKYFGPFEVEENIVIALPGITDEGAMEELEPIVMLERRLGKLANRPVMYVLVQWKNQSRENATSEIYGDLVQRENAILCGQRT